MSERVGRDTWEPRLCDRLGPDALGALIVAIAPFGRKDEIRIIGLVDALKERDRGGAQRSKRLSGLAVLEHEQAFVGEDLGPPQSGDFVAAATGEHPKASDVDGFRVHAFCLELVEGCAQASDFIERQVALSPIVGLSDSRRLTRVALRIPSLAPKS